MAKEDLFLIETREGTKSLFAEDLARRLNGLINTKDILENITLADLEEIGVGGLETSDIFLVEKATGEKRKISGNEMLYEIINALGVRPTAHKMTFRGKDLGSVFTDEQKAEIRNRTYRDMFVGDYWTIGDKQWRIVDIEFFMGIGPNIESRGVPHLVIMPDTPLDQKRMHSTDVVTGGYAGTELRTSGLTNTKTIVKAAFGESSILVRKEMLSNSNSNMTITGVAWFDSDIDIPDEVMLNGHGSLTTPMNRTSRTQFAAIRMHPLIFNPFGNTFWVRDIGGSSSVTEFTMVDTASIMTRSRATVIHGIRPYFCLRG